MLDSGFRYSFSAMALVKLRIWVQINKISALVSPSNAILALLAYSKIMSCSGLQVNEENLQEYK